MVYLLKLITVLCFHLTLAAAGYYYILVKTTVPLSGIIKKLQNIKKTECVLSCELSRDCDYSAMDLQNKNCLHLNTIDASDANDSVAVNLFDLTGMPILK